jgi:stage IV sporulation protein FB
MKDYLTLSLFGEKVKVDVLFLVTIIVFGVFGYLNDFTLFFVSLLLHELGHVIAAKGYGIKLESIHVLPFGCKQTFSSIGGVTYSQEIVIALSGPITNLFLASIILFCNQKLDTLLGIEKVIEINLILAALNLFPALPLDGGRIMRALLSKIVKRTTANKVVSLIGIIFGAMLHILGIYFSIKGQFILGLYVFGVFILMHAIKEYRQDGFNVIRHLTKDNIDKQSAINVKRVAVYKNCMLKKAIKEFESGKYNIVAVIDDDMHILGELNEKQVLNAMMAFGQNVIGIKALTCK